ncbi:MAG: hypothetical protein HGA53_10995, partial [Anaerolineaceae bacterium]|nr:hypothetical protein [Anaerolineaceae bacterium]
QIQSLDTIQNFTVLEEIYLSQTSVVDLSPLLALPRLRLVEVDEKLRAAAEALADQAQFKIIFQ